MIYYLIVCRSLTYAQKTEKILERGGITARVLRSPKSIAGNGCSHSVKVSQPHLTQAIALLKRAELPPKNIFVVEKDGTYREVGV